MRLRMYLTLPDLVSARQLANDLLLARIEDRHMHFLARRGTDVGDLREAGYLIKTDVVHAAGVGLALGALGGLLLGCLAVGYPQLMSGGYGWIQEAIDGKLALRGAPPGTELRTVALSGFVSRFGSAGTVRIATNREEGEAVEDVSEPVHLAAQWFGPGCRSAVPDVDSPGVALPEGTPLNGRDFESALLALREHSPIPLVWDDASESHLSLGLEALGSACAVDDGASRLSLRGGVRVQLDTADGTISGTLDGVVRNRMGNSRAMDSIELTAQLTAPAGEFQRQLALAGPVTPEYDNVHFSLGLWLGQGHVTGSMQVVSTPAQCDSQAVQADPACSDMSVLGAGLGPDATPDATFESTPPP